MSTTNERVHENGTDPIALFLEEQSFHGRTDRTVQAYRRVLRRFEEYVNGQTDHETLAGADRRTCMGWIDSLRDDVAPSTVATYASYLHRFYAYMVQIGEFDRNPMRLVMEELTESIGTDPTRRDISIERMQAFVGSIRHPLRRGVILTFLKTGMRVGELCNLDCRDLNVPGFTDRYRMPAPRGALEGRSGALFVSAEPTVGRTYNGERRSAANKRQRDSIIPVDDELEVVLDDWLSIRPDTPSPADPLFVNTRGRWGERLTPGDIRRMVRKAAEPWDWYTKGGSRTENVTPHYFRHFFTTHMRDRTGDRGIVKYLRGDVEDDILDTYTHNWGDRVRKHYLSHIYSLLDRPSERVRLLDR